MFSTKQIIYQYELKLYFVIIIIIFLDLYLVLHPEGALKLDQPAYVKEIYKLYMQRLEKKILVKWKKKIRIKSPGRPDQRAKFSKLSSEVSWDNKRFYLR